MEITTVGGYDGIITEVEIQEGIISIGENAFCSLCYLNTVIIPQSLERVGSYAFVGCPWLEELPDGDVYIGKTYYCYKGDMPENTEITIKAGTKYIAPGVFWESSGYGDNLTSVTFEENTGWFVLDVEIDNNSYEDVMIDVTNPSTNARMFTTASWQDPPGYYYNYWKRIND